MSDSEFNDILQVSHPKDKLANMSDKVTFSNRSILALILSLGIIGLLIMGDLIEDMRGGEKVWDMFAEFTPFLLVASSIVVLTWRLIKANNNALKKAERLSVDLAASKEYGMRWRAEAQTQIDGLSIRIAAQFSSWCLTPAEKEVALLLLKGYSHKSLAEMRNISDATARQQARAVYRKAGLTGRHDLAAFFLEDLALPTEFSRE